MSVATNSTASPAPPTRPRRHYPKAKRRKTFEFAVYSEEHQLVLVEALEMLDSPALLKRKRTVISWMLRRLHNTLQVHARS